MGRQLDLDAMIRNASPRTRREILKLAAKGGIAAPVLLGLLARDGVRIVEAAPARQEGTPKEGGTFVVTGHQEVDTLNPDNQGASIPAVCINQIHNALIERDENLVWQPILAESLPEMSEDGLTFTFKLRQGVMFHNGEEFTSADVKGYFEYQMDPANATILGSQFSSIGSIEAPDEYTVIFKLKTVDASFYSRVGANVIPNWKNFQEVGPDDYSTKAVGTGAFQLESWDPAASTLLKAFPDHFRGAPHLAEFRLDVVPEPSVRAIGLETGDADSSAWPLVIEDNLKFAAETDKFTTFVTSSLGPNHIPLNNRKPQLSDKRVRQAMMYAIDRQAVIDDIFQGAAVVAVSNFSPAATDWFNPNVTQYTYDPAKAAALLDEAGWVLDGDVRKKDGETLSFVCTTISGDQVRRPEAEVIQQYLKDVGIDMQLAEAPVATILEQLPKGELDASLFNWTYGELDPDATVSLSSTGPDNFSGFQNARVDELLAAGLVELDQAKRKAIYDEIQQIVSDEVPFLYLMYWNWYNIFNNRVKGLPESAKSGFEIYPNAYKWWIEE